MTIEMQDLQAVQARLERVEKSNRMLKRMLFWAFAWAVVVVVVSLSVALSGQRRPSTSSQANAVITSREFRLLDEAGKILADLKTETGTPALTLYDKEGKETVHLSKQGFRFKGASLLIDEKRQMLTLNGADGQYIFLDSTIPQVEISHKQKITRFDQFGLSITDLDKKEGGQLSAFANSLGFDDPQGRLRVDLEVSSDGPRLVFYETNGEPRAILGGFSLQNPPKGNVIKRSTSSLLLVGAGGKVLWSAP